MGSVLKLLSMSWYKSMKPFQNNLKLVIKKYMCIWHEYLPGVDSSSNDIRLVSSQDTHFSIRDFILVHYKVVHSFSHPILSLFSHLNSALQNLVMKLCRALKMIFYGYLVHFCTFL